MPRGETDLFAFARKREGQRFIDERTLDERIVGERPRARFGDGLERDSYDAGPSFGAGAPSTRSVALADTRTICSQIALALAHCAAVGVAHRDVKPENVLIDEEVVGKDRRLRATLVDFGSATAAHTVTAQHGVARESAPLATAVVIDAEPADVVLQSFDLVGSPGFMAPEMLAPPYDAMKVDTWSLGCLALELVFGIDWFHANWVVPYKSFVPGRLHDRLITSLVSVRARALEHVLTEHEQFVSSAGVCMSLPPVTQQRERCTSTFPGGGTSDAIMPARPPFRPPFPRPSTARALRHSAAAQTSAQRAPVGLYDFLTAALEIDPHSRLDARRAVQQAWLV